jgi:hypothetical protein
MGDQIQLRVINKMTAKIAIKISRRKIKLQVGH